MTTQRDERGFTLIEIMIVVVILGILAAMIVPRIMGRPDEARAMKGKVDIKNIEAALNLYRLDNGRYPTAEQGLASLVKAPTIPPAPAKWRAEGYLPRAPLDPWDRPYAYLCPGEHGEFDLYSLGADGEPGGSGADADIQNWNLQ